MSHTEPYVTKAPSEFKDNNEKIWVYYTKCDDRGVKVRCNICSLEILDFSDDILWNHVDTAHSINHIDASELHQGSEATTIKSALVESFDDTQKLEATMGKALNTKSITSHETKIRNMQKSKQDDLRNLRKNLSLTNYQDDTSTLSSTKSMPSTSSLTWNLMSRLSDITTPVKRKLKFWNKKSFQVNQYDPSFKVIYLGNLGTQLWSKDESCLEKPLNTLWNNYLVNMKTEIVMRLTICNSGLKAITRQHGLTQYWSNRLVYCCCHSSYPRIFAWVYRHEGKKMRQELRCHAVFCPSPEKATKMVTILNQRLALALQEFRREKKSHCHSTSSTNSQSSLHKLPRTIPLRRQILAKGSTNFRPPLERSKSAPKLTSIIEEDYDIDDLELSQEELIYEETFDHRDDIDDDEDTECRLFLDGLDNSGLEYSNSSNVTVNEESGADSHNRTKNIVDRVLSTGNSSKNTNDGGPNLIVDGPNISINIENSSHMSEDIEVNLSPYPKSPDTYGGIKTTNNQNSSSCITQPSANVNRVPSSFQNNDSEVINHDKEKSGNFKKQEVNSDTVESNKSPSSVRSPGDHSNTDDTQEMILSWSNKLVIR